MSRKIEQILHTGFIKMLRKHASRIDPLPFWVVYQAISHETQRVREMCNLLSEKWIFLSRVLGLVRYRLDRQPRMQRVYAELAMFSQHFNKPVWRICSIFREHFLCRLSVFTFHPPSCSSLLRREFLGFTLSIAKSGITPCIHVIRTIIAAKTSLLSLILE